MDNDKIRENLSLNMKNFEDSPYERKEQWNFPIHNDDVWNLKMNERKAIRVFLLSYHLLLILSAKASGTIRSIFYWREALSPRRRRDDLLLLLRYFDALKPYRIIPLKKLIRW